MAHGIELCASCKHRKPFDRAKSEPAYLLVQNSGMLRAVMRSVGVTSNRVSIMDENQVVRSTLTVPDDAIDHPGKIKEATRLCEEPVGRECGAEILLKLVYDDQQQ